MNAPVSAPVDISPEATELACDNLYGATCSNGELDAARQLLRALRAALTASEQRSLSLEQRLLEIGDKAHARSTGPALRDDWWEVRGMAYELLRKLG